MSKKVGIGLLDSPPAPSGGSVDEDVASFQSS